MRVLLIRHGQSANNVLAESQGHDYAAYMAGRVPEPPQRMTGTREEVVMRCPPGGRLRRNWRPRCSVRPESGDIQGIGSFP